MGTPIIKTMELNDDYRYLWLKYITGVDLSQHCARAFIGTYSNKLKKTTKQKDVRLDEAEAKVYYLCGVTAPFRYEDNVHLAFRYKKGSSIAGKVKGIRIEIEDAELIQFGRGDIIQDHPHAKHRAYFTCRNWQFACKMSQEWGE